MTGLTRLLAFAGNGEPTIHPEFSGIIDDTIAVRNKFAPDTKIGVLSNASVLRKKSVVTSLKKIDQNVQKLDTGLEEKFKILNQPKGNLSVEKVVQNLQMFEGKVIIQILFLRGRYDGQNIDNTSEKELDAWIPLVKLINPEYVMMYTIDRETPAAGLEKIHENELMKIAARIESEGVRTKVYT